MRLWYEQPAQTFTEALPIGNGRLGAMQFGGIRRDEFRLNEDALWSGSGQPQQMNPGAFEALPEIRRLLLSGELEAAHKLIRKRFLCRALGSYQPLGSLFITHETLDETAVTDYQRELSLDDAVQRVSFRTRRALITREAFCSYPDGALVIRITSEGAPLVLAYSLACPHPHALEQTTDGLTLAGRCPAYAEPSYALSDEPLRYDETGKAFSVRMRVTQSRNEALFVLSAAAGERGQPVLPQGDWDALLARHLADYRPLFAACTLELPEGPNAALPTDRRLLLHDAAPEDDNALAALLFSYGRYLLLACSRPGSRAANLQGLWSDSRFAAWSCNYTLNINTEMNYWPAEPANLSACHEPLFALIEALAENGAEVARHYYGCGGWVAHHNADGAYHAVPMGQWGSDESYGTVTYGMWPMSGAWLCQHLWLHYAYTLDAAFLARMLPLMRGAVVFMLDFLVKHGEYWVTCPSTSPENGYVVNGKTFSATYASTMDMAILRELFGNYIEACQTLDLHDDVAQRARAALPALFPYQIGPHGELLEWPEPYEEQDPHHRHTSHLFALHPGHSITPEETPALADACAVTLTRRGDGGTGWSLGWKINFWARLNDGDHALLLLRRQLRPADTNTETYGPSSGGTYPNLFDAHPPFQIDGNFAATSGVCEMLLRSLRIGEVRLLPALPSAWPEGGVAGLKARGGLTVDITWREASLLTAKLRADKDITVTVLWQTHALTLRMRAGECVALTADSFNPN